MKNMQFRKRFDVKLFILSFLVMASVGYAQEPKKLRIAVMDFAQTTQAPALQNLEKIVPEWLTLFLVETGTFDVIERRDLENVLKEQSLGQTGVIDATSAAQLGKVLGVNILVTGTLILFEDTIEITAKLVDTTNGAIIGVASVTTVDTKALRAKVKELAEMVSQKLSGGQGKEEEVKFKETFDENTFNQAQWSLGFNEKMTKADQQNTKYVVENGVLKITGKYPPKKDASRIAWWEPRFPVMYSSIEAKIRVRTLDGELGICLNLNWHEWQKGTILCSGFTKEGGNLGLEMENQWTDIPTDALIPLNQWYVLRLDFKDGQFHYYWPHDQIIKSLTPPTPVDALAQPTIGFDFSAVNTVTIEIDEIGLR